MEDPKPNYTKNLVEILKVFSWFDDKRWRQKIRRPDAFVENILEDDALRPAQKILAHWLIYITDRGKRAEKLWENNTPQVKELVKRYFSKDLLRKDKVTELCNNYEKEKENRIQALPADLESIKRTLILLLDYDKNIIKFMTRKLSEWAKDDPEKFCPRIAFSLYLLSYKDVGSLAKSKESREQHRNELNKKMKEAKGILNDDHNFEREFNKWYKGDKRWNKRIWAALRDYKKFESLSGIFIKGIETHVDEQVWNKNFAEQLELPGDIWNNRFFEHCIQPIAKNMSIILTGKKPQKVVRDLWVKIKSKCPGSYPEQLDVTFDFAPRMCEKKLCSICPFGPNGAKSICIPTEDRSCPVSLVSCGYIFKCADKQGSCVIKEGLGKGTCKGLKVR